MRHDHILRVTRLTALCDGVFAIAMTILVVEIRVPNFMPESNLSHMLLADILRNIFIYCGSFIILGTQWLGINFQHGFLHRVNRHYLWANIIYLMTIGIIPFSAHLIINYHNSMASVVFYSINLLCCSLMQLLIWQCGNYFKLYTSDYNSMIKRIIAYRLFMPTVFYASAIVIAYWNSLIAFIVLAIPPIFYFIPGKLDTYIKKHE
jgi:uncharacterized membrane protein